MRFALDSDTDESGSTELERKMAESVNKVLFSFVDMVDFEAKRQKDKKGFWSRVFKV